MSGTITLTKAEADVIAKLVREKLEDLDWAMPADDGPVGDEIRALESIDAKIDAAEEQK